jgi:flagellin-like protein
MNFEQLLTDDDAVSPVIGVILMVAITVILAAVIGTFVLGLGDQVSNTSPTASFTFDLDENGGGSDELSITHDGGDKIDGANLNGTLSGAAVNNGAVDSADLGVGDNMFTGTISAGSTETLTNETVRNRNTSVGSEFVNAVGSDEDGDRELDLSGSTFRVVWTSSNGGDSATLGKWTGPDA